MKGNYNIELLRAIVRPIAVLYCLFILSVLAIMQSSGYSMPSEGVGADIVTAFIAITGTVTVEWSAERGIRHLLARRKSAARVTGKEKEP